MEVVSERMQQLRAQMQDIRKRYLAAAKEAFFVEAKRLFEEHSIMESFSWEQYTPYFNDGGTCEFSVQVGEDYGLTINGLDHDDTGSYEPTGKIKSYKNYRGEVETYPETEWVTDPELVELLPLFGVVAEFINAFSEDSLKDMFGDHAKITVSRDGTVDVESVDHE